MRILSSNQTKELDKYTIETEPISSLDLMERASQQFVNLFTKKYPNRSEQISIFCGIGNNGGDAYAIARMLHKLGYNILCFAIRNESIVSNETKINYDKLKHIDVPIINIDKIEDLNLKAVSNLIIDGLFGHGLNRALSEFWSELVEKINSLEASIIAIDMPSGLFSDIETNSTAIKAKMTFSFQFPKLAFFFKENWINVGSFHILDIGLASPDSCQIKSKNYYFTNENAVKLLRQKSKFDHKGLNGHCLVVGGKTDMMGSIRLAAEAAFRSGCGLVSCLVPTNGKSIIQTSLPEAMLEFSHGADVISQIELSKSYDSIGIGCGLGTDELTASALLNFLKQNSEPLILDADALNIISKREALKLIPKNSIITPHVKEFERLFGVCVNSWERNRLQIEMATRLNIIIVLKGAYSSIALPDGRCFFNSSGNPGMATAGSGDVLTGIISSLKAQSYSPEESALLGVYIHGLAGDLAADKLGFHGLIASDIISNLPKAIKSII